MTNHYIIIIKEGEYDDVRKFDKNILTIKCGIGVMENRAKEGIRWASLGKIYKQWQFEDSKEDYLHLMLAEFGKRLVEEGKTGNETFQITKQKLEEVCKIVDGLTDYKQVIPEIPSNQVIPLEEKIVKDFDLRRQTNKGGPVYKYGSRFIISFWQPPNEEGYKVWRYSEAKGGRKDGNKPKVFKITNQKEEDLLYQYVKERMEYLGWKKTCPTS